MLLFAVTPAELLNATSEAAAERVAWLADLGWKIGILFGLFALPFALVALAVAELRGLRRWWFYVGLAVFIAAIGFVIQLGSTLQDSPAGVGLYALAAHLTTAIVAGTTYWLVSGRWAGGVAAGHHPLIIEPLPQRESAKPAPQSAGGTLAAADPTIDRPSQNSNPSLMDSVRTATSTSVPTIGARKA